MADAAKTSLLKKHVAPPRPVVAAVAGAIEKLLAVELPRAADQLLSLQVKIQSVSLDKLDQENVVAALNDNDLICRMSHAGSHIGLIVVDPMFVSVLTEIQTLGKVTGAAANERPPTNTDVTVVSEILDRWLSDIARAASEQGLVEELLTTGFTRDPGRLDLRAVELTLDPGQYRLLRVTMAFGADAKLGTLSFYAPLLAASGDDFGETLGRQLRAHLLDAPVELTAVLTRAPRSLDKILSLRAGDVLPVLTEKLQSIRLETDDGTVIATARLGQAGGRRAVRLSGQEYSQKSPPARDTRTIEKTPFDTAAGAAATVPQQEIGQSIGEAAEPILDTNAQVPSETFPELPGPLPSID